MLPNNNFLLCLGMLCSPVKRMFVLLFVSLHPHVSFSQEYSWVSRDVKNFSRGQFKSSHSRQIKFMFMVCVWLQKRAISYHLLILVQHKHQYDRG